MTTELWRHMVTWELRQALRSAAFWVMAAMMVVTPFAAPLLDNEPLDDLRLMPYVAAAEIVLLSLLVCLWTVFAVKRQVAADVSDDWLLVLRYRQSLVSRYLAGWCVGVLLIAVSAVADAVVLVAAPLYLPGAEQADWASLSARCGAWLLLQVLKLVSLIQPLAMASIIIAAADFLVASTPVVLFVLVCLDLAWCALPVAGFAVPAVYLTDFAGSVAGWTLLAAALAFGLFWFGFGWAKAEDFWIVLKLALDKRKESLAAVRTAIGERVQQSAGLSRAVNSRSRAFWTARGLAPLIAHDLARYPWGPRRTGRKYLTWQIVACSAVLVVASCYASAVRNEPVLSYLFYFAWWIVAIVLLVRALVSGAQIVVQEREQGTLGCLVTSPLGMRRVLTAKLIVVLLQAAPLLLLLMLAWSVRYRGDVDTPFFLLCLTVSAALGGVAASCLSSNRLTALLVGGVLFGLGWFVCWSAGGWWYTVLIGSLPSPRSAMEFVIGQFGLGVVSLAAASVAVWWAAVRPLARRVEQVAGAA